MILPILTYPDVRLHQIAEPVIVFDDSIVTLANDMAETMYAGHGVGLAATQVGVLKRVIVIDLAEPNERSRLITLVNPAISTSGLKQVGVEGCLSFPDQRVNVSRWTTTHVDAFDEFGKPLSFDATGLMAVAVQHECDHLDGVLIADRVSTAAKLALGIRRR